MPLDLTDAEPATAATACRAMAYQEGERAKKMENPTMRGLLEANSKRLPPWRRNSRRLTSGQAPNAHTRGPPEPRLPFPPRRESLEDRPAHRDEGGASNCLLVHACRVVQAADGVTTENLTRW